MNAVTQSEEIRLRAREDRSLLADFTRRNWWVFVLCLGLAAIAAVLFIANSRPEYEATAVLLIQPQGTGIDDRDAAVATPELVRSQVSIIQSQRVLAAVVDRLGLEDDPAFTRDAPANAGPRDLEAAARDELADRLTVENDGRSYTINLSVSAEDPARAAQITNTAATTFIELQKEQKVGLIESTQDALGQRLTDLRAQAIEAEDQAEAFRRQSGLLPLSSLPEDAESYTNATPSSREIIELTRERAGLAADRATAVGKMRAQESAIRRGQGGSTAEVLASPVITQLRIEQSQLERQESELLAKYTPDHPLVIPVRAELQQLRATIADEIARIHASVRSSAEASSDAVGMSNSQMSALEGKRSRDLAASIRLRQLQRDAQLSRDNYERYASQMQQTTERAGLQLPDVVLISAASPPLRDEGQPAALIVLLALAAGFLLAAPIAIFRSMQAGRRERHVAASEA